MTRTPTLTAIAWCAGCRHWLPESDAGTRCPAEGCTRTMRRRIAQVCPDCPERDAWFDRAALAAHYRDGAHTEP